MNLAAAAEEIKRTVGMERILDAYGYRTKHGKMLCPFHADRNESLKVYGGRGWYCFGCGRGGTVIDFVMAQEGCGFGGAVAAIDDVFGLGLARSADPLDIDRTAAIRRQIDALAARLTETADALDEYLEGQMAILTRQSRELYAKPRAELTADEWTRRLALDDEMDRTEYRMEKCREIREEVREWKTTKYREFLTSTRPARNRTPNSGGAQSA